LKDPVKRFYSQFVKTIPASFRISSAINVWLRPSSLLWHFAGRRLIVGYRRFDTNCRALYARVK